MRSLYQPISKAVRAALYRKDAEECSRAGFEDFATINREMAAILTPKPPRIEREEGDDDER